MGKEEGNLSAAYNRTMDHLIQAFLHNSGIDKVMREFLDVASRDNGIDRAYIMERAEDGFFSTVYSFDPGNLAPGFPVYIPEDDVLKDGYNGVLEPVFVSDAPAALSEREHAAWGKDVKSFAQLPISYNDAVIGIARFEDYRGKREWTDDERRIFIDFATIFGVLFSHRNLEIAQKHLLEYMRNEEEMQRLLLDSLQSQELKTTLALEGANSFSWEYIPGLGKLILNRTAEPALGYPLDYFEQKRSRYMENLAFNYAAEAKKKMTDYLEGRTDIYTIEYPIITADGSIRWYLARGKCDENSKDVVYGVCIDITDSKLHEQRLSERAYKDDLTGLFSKQYLFDGLIEPSGEDFDNFGGILFDVKSFKNINDAFGYDRGDRIIESIAGRLKAIIPSKIIVRTSGNRFLAVFENTDIEVLKGLAVRVLHEFEKPVLTDGQIIKIDFRVGIAISNRKDAKKLLNGAEIALNCAKESLTDSFCVLSDSVELEFKKKVNLEFELREAIERQEFVLYYQPKVSVSTEKTVGAEALIRWNHPELGIVSPLDFIPLAEETGLIVPIGEFVILETARQLRKWLDDGFDIYVSFNVSVKQFLSPNLRSCIHSAIERYNIPQNHLVIEITESTMILDFKYVEHVLIELCGLGVGVSLDDFGTGYSSMSYLGKIPLDDLKIDKSLIDNATTVVKDKAILESILTMAHKLGLKVVAEGVENAEQFNMLKELSCDMIQGYFFSKPLNEKDFEAYIRAM